VRAQKIILFLVICSSWIPLVHGTEVFLPGDELTLPPLLYEVLRSGKEEGRLNLTAPDQHSYEAAKGEWLDYGDSFNIPNGLAFQIIQKETLQWVGGGQFSGKIGMGSLVKDDRVYDLTLTHGWIKVWIKPDSNHSSLMIHTHGGDFLAKNGIFWMNTRLERTEVYLVQGELITQPGGIPLTNRGYALYEKGKDKPLYIAKDWDPQAIEVRIAASYPQFIQLAGTAQQEWEDGKISRTYAIYRKKGWRKASRLEPNSK
jgi:hypothetical protein